MRKLSAFLIFLMFLFVFLVAIPQHALTQAASSGSRLALVIGNSAYDFSPLKNPVNDATDLASSLQGLGFTVILKKNANFQAMEEALEDFGNQLKKGGTGLFFYAGHGVQVAGNNYLIPVGAKINKESDVKFKAVDANRVFAEMENANNGLNIVILDACRDNPFQQRFRSASRGLAIISDAPIGTFIAYSTGPGKVASDGEGRNSPYTSALIEYIKEPGLTIEDVFKSVRQKLNRETSGKQTPWELSSLQGKFYFNTASDIAATTRPTIVDNQHLEREKQRLEIERQKIEEEKRNIEEQKLAMAARPKPAPASPPTSTDSATGMEFVFVKGGCFDMGDTFGDGDSDEKPVHEVCVSDFYMGKYEVTQGQWQAIIGSNPSYFKNCGNTCPVEQVSWNDIQEFIQKLNSRTGKSYRLPTEAEWEYAARSGGKSKYYAGTSSSPDDYAWYSSNSGNKTHPVGQKQPNDLDLYDMSGNVWEWCNDWYGKDYYSGSPRDNPRGPTSGSSRVLRGGSLRDGPRGVRVSDRFNFDPSFKGNGGFRLLLVP